MPDTWTISDRVAWSDASGRIALVNLDLPQPAPLILEKSAVDLWRAIASGATTAELAATAADWGLDSQIAEAFVGELHDLGLVAKTSTTE